MPARWPVQLMRNSTISPSRTASTITTPPLGRHSLAMKRAFMNTLNRPRHPGISWVIYLIAVILSVTFLFPLFWMASTSLKTMEQAYAFPPIWIPQPVKWDNYVKLFTELPTESHDIFMDSVVTEKAVYPGRGRGGKGG